jgi:hypothetical protein
MPNNIDKIQTRYALRKVLCRPYVNDAGLNTHPGFLNVKIEKPFLLLDRAVSDVGGSDSDASFDQGIQNDLVFLASHPIVQILQVAEVSDFHIAPGSYSVPDERTDITQEQFLFVLLCLNFV